MKAIQWNIGGGKLHNVNGNDDGLAEIIKTLKSLKADVITLQEIHIGASSNQAQQIADGLGWSDYVSDVLSPSYLEEGQSLGLAILSRFPISQHSFKQFDNPRLETIGPNGNHEYSHDKGVTSCFIQVDRAKLAVKTLHLLPFHRFGVPIDSEKGTTALQDLQVKVGNLGGNTLIQGDFNLDYINLNKLLPKLFSQNLSELPQTEPTSIYGRCVDHVLFTNDIVLSDHKVIKTVRTDHYPIVCEFELK